MTPDEKYPALSKIAVAFRVLGWISSGAGVLFGIIILIGGGRPQSPRSMSLVALILGAFYFLLFYGIGEIMRVLMDIESNTRAGSDRNG